MIVRSLAVLLALAALVPACSSSDDGAGATPAGGSGASRLAAFEGYCTATLSVDTPMMLAEGAGSWQGNGKKVAAGTTFLVSADFHRWGGYVILEDGSPAELVTESAGLVKDKDFTSSCATDPEASTHFVLLRKSTFYPTAELTGTACALEAGTVFRSYSFSGLGEVATLSADGIKSTCNLETAYSKDIAYGSLVPMTKLERVQLPRYVENPHGLSNSGT
jgi:hypothetical protein